jgi:NADH dehydrogenase FAD-containing subunit
MAQLASSRHQVVVIGSGFGGLFGTKALKRANVDVTVIAETSHHLFQPLLYQVAAGILPEGLIAPAIRSIVGRQATARTLLAEVEDLDLDGRVVVVGAGPTGVELVGQVAELAHKVLPLDYRSATAPTVSSPFEQANTETETMTDGRRP